MGTTAPDGGQAGHKRTTAAWPYPRRRGRSLSACTLKPPVWAREGAVYKSLQHPLATVEKNVVNHGHLLVCPVLPLPLFSAASSAIPPLQPRIAEG